MEELFGDYEFILVKLPRSTCFLQTLPHGMLKPQEWQLRPLHLEPIIRELIDNPFFSQKLFDVWLLTLPG